MKATIAGIIYEGTPEEISRMVLLQQAESKRKPLGTEEERQAYVEEMKRIQQTSGTGQADFKNYPKTISMNIVYAGKLPINERIDM